MPSQIRASTARRFGIALLLLAAVSAVRADEAAPNGRIDIEASYSDLTHGLEPWREGALRGSYALDEIWTVGGAVEAASRFDSFDAYFEGRADGRISDAASFYVLVGGTPEADFRPRVAAGTGGAVRLLQGDGIVAAAVATLDLRYADYAAGNVETVNPGLEVYLFRGRASLTARHINIWDETNAHRTGYFLRADAQADDTVTFFAGYADSPDTSGGITVDTTSWFGGVAVDIAPDTTVRLALAQEMHESGYDRTTFTLSATLKR